MRLAWFTPFAPVRSGISAYSAELLPLVSASHEVDVFVEDEVWTHWAERGDGKTADSDAERASRPRRGVAMAG